MGGENEDQTQPVCPLCGKPVDADASGVIFARERLEMPSVGDLPSRIEGRGAFFHPSCPPELIGWVRRARSSERRKPIGSPRLVCAECGCVSRGEAEGWAAFLAEDTAGVEPSSLGIFCPRCAALEFDYHPEGAGEYT